MRPTLLLADDEQSIRESLRKLFQAEQYEVVLAVNSQQAVEKFRLDPAQFDLLLLDLNMPLRNGLASIDRFLEVNPRLPIVLLTRMPHQRELAQTSHVSALVEKPIDVPTLLSFTRELLTEIERSKADGLPHQPPPFQFLPANQFRGPPQQADPYSHWGFNE